MTAGDGLPDSLTAALRPVLDGMVQGLQVVGFDWRYVYVNRSAAQHGRREPPELLGRTMQEVYPGIDRTPLFEAMQRCMLDRRPCRMENLFDYGDGTSAWFDIRIVPIAEGILVESADISERRASQDLLGAFFDSSLIGILFGDVHGNILDANDELLRIVGYSREDLVQGRLRWLDITPPEFLPLDEAGIVQAAERGACEPYEKQYIRKDGTRIWVLVGYVLVGSSREQSVAFVLDITESKRNREALHVSQESLRLFIDHAPAAVAMFDREMRYLAASRRWIADYRLDAAGLAGQCHYDVFPEIGDDWKSVHRRGLAGEVIVRDVDRFEREDGTVQWLRWEVRPWDLIDGSVGGIVIFTEDITERERARDALRRHRDLLEAEVARRTFELENANRELEAFAYSVSHDLRAPLRSIDGFSQALLEDFGGGLPEEAQDYLGRVRANAQHMGRLIEDLLKLSRVTRAELVPKRVDLSAIASEVAADLAEGDGGRSVEVSIAQGLEAVGDERLLRVVLANLLGNAWKFTARKADARIEVGARRRDGETVFFVRDNGAGFEMEYAHKLFGAFQRLHSTADYEGSGIGLATVQRIVRRHGGEIWAEGVAGEGASFFFTLPPPREAQDEPSKGGGT